MTTFFFHGFDDIVLDLECFNISDGMFVTAKREYKIYTFFIRAEFCLISIDGSNVYS